MAARRGATGSHTVCAVKRFLVPGTQNAEGHKDPTLCQFPYHPTLTILVASGGCPLPWDPPFDSPVTGLPHSGLGLPTHPLPCYLNVLYLMTWERAWYVAPASMALHFGLDATVPGGREQGGRQTGKQICVAKSRDGCQGAI